MSSKDLINQMVGKVPEKDMADIAKTSKTVNIELSDSSPFRIVIGNGKIDIADGKADKADATVKCTDQVLSDIITGKLNAFSAFMSGKVTVSGDLFFVQKMITVLGKGK
ncbi:SCP2 sterol-binding domain-containing protein [Thermoplasma sp.]|uniref:SCP2 sterol-binding domain-containing protein n=1 Tax=Thermoplasma sp. TaxID=1973142 RepID=UPI001283E90F|nr:SCP2 sterol-binding domain-containing protein [Thermoplasma sp.]KAA8922748.1 MAG: sterol carrier protein [Thermoplasma sp.]